MRIGIVGGVERNEATYREIAERAGHSLFFHPGHIAGRGSEALVALARSVDLLIVLTDVNSHGAVHIARREARRWGVPLMLQRRCSPARLKTIVADLQAQSDRAAASGEIG